MPGPNRFCLLPPQPRLAHPPSPVLLAGLYPSPSCRGSINLSLEYLDERLDLKSTSLQGHCPTHLLISQPPCTPKAEKRARAPHGLRQAPGCLQATPVPSLLLRATLRGESLTSWRVCPGPYPSDSFPSGGQTEGSEGSDEELSHGRRRVVLRKNSSGVRARLDSCSLSQ